MTVIVVESEPSRGVQRGLVTLSSTTPETVTVSPVDMKRSHIELTWTTSASSGSIGAAPKAELISATEIFFSRVNSTNTTTISWELVTD